MKNKRMLLVLWVTGECNLSCAYCYAAKSSGHMTKETAHQAVQKFKDRPLTIQFAGGEPLLNWELIKYVVQLTEEENLDVRLQLQTNGTCMTREIAAFIKEHHIAVGVSLDGVPQVNEQLRGKTPQVIEGIRILQAEGVRVNINAVVTSKNADQLPMLVDFVWYLENVEGIGLDILRRSGRGVDSFEKLCPSADQILEALEKMEARSRQLAEISGKKIVLREVADARSRLDLKKRVSYCYASCGDAVAVLPDGECYPCGSLTGLSQFYMGNVYKEVQPIALKTPSIISADRCGDCPGKEVCPGACPSRQILNNETEQDCALRRTAFELAEKWYV